MTTRHDLVFLFDVDNTLLNNDRVQGDLFRHLARAFGELAPLPAEAVDALYARYKNYYGQR